MLVALVVFGASPQRVAAQGAQGGQAPLNAQGIIMPTDPTFKPTGPVPRTADGHPDLSGVWWQGGDFNFGGRGRNGGQPQAAAARGAAPAGGAAPARGQAPAAPAPRRVTWQSLYTPEYVAKAKPLSDKDDPSLYCIPEIDGPQQSDIFQLVQTPKFLIYLQETLHGFRIIPLDGRPHSEEAPPAFRGDSTAHWEGDTLVVDVTNFNIRNWVFYGVNGPPSLHSDALHVVERYTRTAANALEVERTYTDPKALTQPWVRPKKVFMSAPFDRVMEVVCTINDTGALMNAAAKGATK
jgi:hypothetical protein